MKKKIIKYGIRVIAVIICFAVIVTVVKSVQNKSQQFGTKDTVKYTEGLEELSLSDGAVLENENLALYVDENYCISLLDKKTGKVWNSSIPEEMQKNFNVSSDAAVSACNITYLAKDNTVVEYDSYKQSALREQIKMYAAENSVRITYIFGERTSDNIIPQAFTEKRFKEMLERCDDDQKDFLKRRYELFNAKTMKAEDNPEEKLKTFTKLKTTPLYIISDVSGKVLIEKTKKLFDDIGYTKADYTKDNELTGYDGDIDECTFKVSYDLKLDGNDLVVTLPVSEISFYAEFPLLSITPLKFFTGSAEAEGEILIPSGSGSVIRFGAENREGSFSSPFFGKDNSEKYEEMPMQMLGDGNDSISMPVYFFTENNSTLMTVVEKGAEAARLYVERSRSSAYAYTSFDVIQNGYAYLTAKKKTLVCGTDSLKSDIVIRYRCLSGKGYSYDAAEYRKYLTESNILRENAEISEKPLFLLETVGAVKSKSGKKLTALTKFDDMKKMFSDISENGNIRTSIKLTGINKGGLLNQVPGSFKYNKDILTANQQSEITELAKKGGGTAYAALNHMYYYNHTENDGYSLSKNNAKNIDKSWAIHSSYNPVEGTYIDNKNQIWVLSPKTYVKTVESYIKSGIKSIGVGDFASDINSDFSNKGYYDRGDSLKQIVKALKLYKENDVYIAAKTANTYALPYIDLIEEMPTSGNKLEIFDEYVPFCQMVLHGSVEYTSPVINYQSDKETAVLKAIETGSGAHFVLNEGIDNTLFKTDSDRLFPTAYSQNRDFAIAAANKIQKALTGLNNKAIVSHSFAGNVAVTAYEDGTKIYVNYNNTDVTVDNITVKARDFLRV